MVKSELFKNAIEEVVKIINYISTNEYTTFKYFVWQMFDIKH